MVRVRVRVRVRVKVFVWELCAVSVNKYDNKDLILQHMQQAGKYLNPFLSDIMYVNVQVNQGNCRLN
jgi:hypothetical protein